MLPNSTTKYDRTYLEPNKDTDLYGHITKFWGINVSKNRVATLCIWKFKFGVILDHVDDHLSCELRIFKSILL